MARQIGPGYGIADPRVLLLEARLNALAARLLALEARQARAAGAAPVQRAVAPGARDTTGGMEPIVEELSEAESLRLITQAEIGRIGFTGRYGPVIVPVNFKVLDGSVIFRTEEGNSIDEDLRTGIAEAEYKVAFEIDQMDPADRTGWSVLIQGAAHYVEDQEERATAVRAGIEPWVGGERNVYVRIKPTTISGRRIRRG
ncbi:MAG TPA: pyridoxamine 5'-phosphate oxidase family protein [Trebonia sp.]|jgi:nitroimidazol reductase NimA-like FMN-containing flavoprotein (pyridoxamine 5'-phosphate oxidase superfamily)|nr:pyridoxamine 5'-phosphate oxidase family protein [Trebonia sp.]